MNAAVLISDTILTLMQAYVLAQKEAGKTEVEAKAELATNITSSAVMSEFLKPVDPVKEN